MRGFLLLLICLAPMVFARTNASGEKPVRGLAYELIADAIAAAELLLENPSSFCRHGERP
jgi:hypothetical protein|tara:strand:+ start:182 stop:361 length:180 start_codon:yes stop_codon:yes gene_type:complete